MQTLSLAGFEEANRHIGEAHMARNWGSPLANSQLGTEALSASAHKELDPATNHIRELKWIRPQLNLNCAWVRRPETGDPGGPRPDPRHIESEQ